MSDAADVVAAIEDQAWVEGVYALSTHAHPDAFDFAIVLEPYNQTNIVATHYAIVAATGGRRIPGKVMYVDAGLSALPAPMAKARRLTLTAAERAAAQSRIAARRAEWEHAPDRVELERDFAAVLNNLRLLRENAAIIAAEPATGLPYRGGISVDFQKGIIAVVPDPFPTQPRPRVLLVTEDPDLARPLQREFEVVHVDDGWAAVEHVEKTSFDVILCALRVSGMSGASLHRLIARTHPEAASKIAFLVSAETASNAPPSSASGRIVALPLTAERVRQLLTTS